jgi:hypothetical protein
MSEIPTELCGKCDAEIDRSRRVDFTLKDGTRVCESCFVKETPRAIQPKRDRRTEIVGLLSSVRLLRRHVKQKPAVPIAHARE